MKRILAVFLSATVILTVAACGEENSSSVDTKTSSEVVSSIDEEPSSSEQNSTIEETTSTPKETTFRNSAWGDSKDTVKAQENEDYLSENEELLCYKGSVSNYQCDIYYSFDNNSLYSGMYYFEDIHTSTGQYINTYYNLKQLLSDKYGTPLEDDIAKFERDSLIEAAGESSALKFGYVTYFAEWQTDDTDISIVMSAENYDIFIGIEYRDSNYVDTNELDGL